jgi:hypothetical protein
MKGCKVNDDLKKMQKKAVAAQFKALSWLASRK